MGEVIRAAQTFGGAAKVDASDYASTYARSIDDADGYWAEQAQRLEWIEAPTTIKNVSFDSPVSIKWYEDGVLNVCYNCVDRHLATRGDQQAILFEGDDPNVSYAWTYKELHERVCRIANVLKDLGVKKGDRVTIYMPMVPDAAAVMLACARIGAIHSVVFGGFSPDSLADRVNGCDSKLIVTCDAGMRGGRQIPLKANTDEALKKCADDVKVLVFRQVGTDEPLVEGAISMRRHWSTQQGPTVRASQ